MNKIILFLKNRHQHLTNNLLNNNIRLLINLNYIKQKFQNPFNSLSNNNRQLNHLLINKRNILSFNNNKLNNHKINKLLHRLKEEIISIKLKYLNHNNRLIINRNLLLNIKL